MKGARLAARIGPPVWGVRLDSGDLVTYSRRVRQILDDAGLFDTKIMVTNDLNEHRVARLLSADAPIDSFGIGTELATSADAPALSAVYKLVELEAGESHRYTAKYSDDKATLPGGKQVYRSADHDFIALYNECNSEFQGAPLLQPVLAKGELLEPYPSLASMREKTVRTIESLPTELKNLDQPCHRKVDISERLQLLANNLRNSRQMVAQ